MDIYAENIIDHYKHPHNKLPLPAGEGRSEGAFVRHAELNASCGDTLTLDLAIENGTVTGIGWTGEGCAISQATMSILSDEIPGKTVAELEGWNASKITGMLGVPVGARRMKCALLSLHTLKNALHAHKNEPVQGWQETVDSQ